MCSDLAVWIRQACGAIGFDRSTFHYQSRRTDQAAVATRIREIGETSVRFGYRRVHVLLDREGWSSNVKNFYRICGKFGMQLGNKTSNRRVKAKFPMTELSPSDRMMSGRWILFTTSWQLARSCVF
jgi:putative transposase